MGLVYVNDRSLKRKRRKLTKEQREAEENFKKLLEKWDKLPKFASGKPVKQIKKAVVAEVDRRLPAKFDKGVAAKREVLKYTGTKVLGVATMHKSNAVPIFSSEEAVEVSTMRRN